MNTNSMLNPLCTYITSRTSHTLIYIQCSKLYSPHRHRRCNGYRWRTFSAFSQMNKRVEFCGATHTHTHTHITHITYMHTYKHTYIHTHMYIHTYMYTYKHTYIHTHMYIHTYMYTYTHSQDRARARTHTHTHILHTIHSCIHTNIYTYIHGIF
jgi:hypothetical protein